MVLGLPRIVITFIFLFLVLSIAVLILSEPWARRRRALVALLAVVAVYLLGLRYFANFPIPQEHFSPTAGTLIVLIPALFGAALLGAAAEHFQRTSPAKVSVRKLLPAACVSPLILLPLIGSIANMTEVNAMQGISLCLLAFQNGFFWKAQLKKLSDSVMS